MKKILIGVALLALFLISPARAAGTSKNEVSIPCYNSGLSFGLAGYSIPSADARVDVENDGMQIVNSESNVSYNAQT